MVAFNIVHKGVYDIACDLIHAVVVVAVFREVAFYFIVDDNAIFIADCLNLCIFDCG